MVGKIQETSPKSRLAMGFVHSLYTHTTHNRLTALWNFHLHSTCHLNNKTYPLTPVCRVNNITIYEYQMSLFCTQTNQKAA